MLGYTGNMDWKADTLSNWEKATTKLQEMRSMPGLEDFRSVVVLLKRTHGSGWTRVLPRYALGFANLL